MGQRLRGRGAMADLRGAITRHKRAFGWAVGLAVAAVAAGLGYWRGTRGGMRIYNAGLRVPAGALDFGCVWASESFLWRLPIYNPTCRVVRIERFETSCSCAWVEPESVVLPPGGRAEVTVRLDLRRGVRDLRGLEGWDFSVRIVPVISGEVPQWLRGWELGGRVRRLFVFDPPVVAYGEDLIRGEPMPARRVRVRTAVPIRGVRAWCEPAPAQVRVVRSGARTRPSGAPQGEAPWARSSCGSSRGAIWRRARWMRVWSCRRSWKTESGWRIGC